MEVKKLFTPEELEELCAWFEARKERLPQELMVLPGCVTHELPKVVGYYIDIVRLHGANPTYTGQIRHLFLIREKLIEDALID